MLARLGVEIVPLPNGEIFSNLQSGAIDGAEWVGPYNDLSLGFYKITKLYYWPGFHEPGVRHAMHREQGRSSRPCRTS